MTSFSITGLNHIGLVVSDIEVAKDWFHSKLGLSLIEDRGELVFLKAGSDIIAIKTPKMAVMKPEHEAIANSLDDLDKFKGWQHLDHYGFFAKDRDEVDAFAAFLKESHISIIKGPYDRSDGRSVYFKDPCGLVGEYFWLRS